MRKFFVTKLTKYFLRWIKELPDQERHQILTEAVKHLFNTISEDDILKRHKEGYWMYGGKRMENAQFQLIQEEVKLLRSMKLWKILKTDIHYQINKKTFYDANLDEDVIWGKLLLWYDDVIETRLKRLSNENHERLL